MSVVPKEVPVYGGGEITYDAGEQQRRNDGDKYYLVFRGSEVRHVTRATAAWNHGNRLVLKAGIPSHSKLETVEVCGYVCSGSTLEIRPVGKPSPLHYGADSAYRMAVYLSTSVDEPRHLDDLELVCRERFQLTPDVQANLDERLTSAFQALQLPPCWNMMGAAQDGAEPAERLVHFSARLGLAQLTAHFLTLPGSKAALSSPNHEGLLPEHLALKAGFHELADLLQYYRKQGASNPSLESPALVAKSSRFNSPIVVSTELNWSGSLGELENDILRLERLSSSRSSVSHTDEVKDANMKELHLQKNGVPANETFYAIDNGILDGQTDVGRSTALPNPSSQAQGRVLEENLRRLRNIHEGIQKLRQLNTKQIVEHQSNKQSSNHLSSSCPTLYQCSAKSDQDAALQSDSLLRMRTLHHRQTSLSSNSRSLDSSLFDAINVKIHINDITPSVSQECLQPTSPVSEEEEHYHYERLLKSSSKGTDTVSNIGGTASRRLAKKSTKKGPVRRQSWSSLGASVSQENADDKQHPTTLRRWSLSSLDSDAEEAFSDVAECLSDQAQQFSPSSSSGVGTCSYQSGPGLQPDVPMEKMRAMSDGNNDESSLSKSAKQSVSVPSMHDIAADIKENVEPEVSLSGDGLNAAAKGFLASFRSAPLQKSLSTPAIAIENNAALDLHVPENEKQAMPSRQSLCVLPPSSSEESRSPASPEADDPCRNMCQPVSLAGVLRESQRLTTSMDSDEEKPFSKRKKRSSIFFKKKPDKHKAKESKKNAHQFIVCQGTSAYCDVCNKPFVKKQALKCENCLIIVHDNSCKDQTVDCNKFKLQSTAAKASYLPVSKDTYGLPATMNGSCTYGQNKNASATIQVHKEKQNGFFGSSQTGIPSLSEAATRSSFVNLGKMISEEKDNDGSCDIQSNIMDINSASMESLDEGAAEISDLEDNSVLRLIEDEPENWHATVDKKILKKLKDREVKRQEAIYELIITEKHHFLTLQIMQKVYAQGMMKELGMSREFVERLLPCLPDLLELHRTFLTQLRERQSESPIVENIADVLEEQFHEQRAEQMKVAYGQFCSQHIEALNLYKEWSKSDRKFQNFIKRCGAKRLCKTKGIPECLLLVTQRITKYILVIESLIKAAKDSKEEQMSLTKVLNNLKEIISQVDVQVAEKEKELRILEIFNKMEPKTAIFYRGKKFKKTDLISNNRRLIRDGPLIWRSPRGKTIDVQAVMVSDLIFFLHENNQKYCFASLENKPGIVSLQKLLVRKKAGQDSRGFYLISSNPNEPEMIELLCRTAKDQKAWMEAVREAVEMCPEEDEGIPSETEQERKLEAARNARVKELMTLLHEKDVGVAQLCEDKMRLLADVLEIVGVDAEQYENVKYSHLVENEFGSETRDLISAAISNASRLANSLYASGTNLSRSVSSAGEHQSEAYVSPLLPKRAETFGGFDNPSKEPVATNKIPVLKKKLLHLKENSEVTNFFPSKPKLDVDFELADSLEVALRGFDSKAKSLSRPSSVCGSPDQHNRKNSVSPSISPQNSIPSSREVPSEITRLTVTPLLVSQGKEQLVQIVELAHYLNTVMCTVSHLSSTVECLKVQMSQVNERMSKLSKEKEVREKRPQYRPEHQLEELRNLQKQLNHDKAVWQQEKAQHETQIKAEREELERLQEQLKNEQEDVTHQRELLYRKLDALQRQGIILSPSHTVLNNCLTRDSDNSKESPSSPLEMASLEYQHHKRAFSYDSHSEPARDVVHSNAAYSSPPGTVALRHESKSRPSVHSAVQPSTSKVVPIHLSSSATNLQKRQTITTQPVKQQLPLKLASTHGACGGAATAVAPNGAPGQAGQGPHQVLPMKLAHGSLPSNIPALVGSDESKSTAAPKRSHSVANSPSSTLTAPVHVRGGSSPALVSYPPNNGLSLSPNASRSENVFQHLKLASDKAKNKKEDDASEEIFC